MRIRVRLTRVGGINLWPYRHSLRTAMQHLSVIKANPYDDARDGKVLRVLTD